MYKNAFFFFVFIIVSLNAFSLTQVGSYNLVKLSDTALKEVVVTAFNTGFSWKDAPAAIATLFYKELQALSPVSMLASVNSIPGVRMEERSPGSYRFSIRGSLLRSPFGVRNVKVYWNEIPFSDATGNTYLNLIDVQQMNGVEIAKGPSASVYGAGTGGVLLLNTKLIHSDTVKNKLTGLFTVGFYGLKQAITNWEYSNSSFSSNLQLSNIQSNGYREQAQLNKTSISWQTKTTVQKQEWNTLFLYTQLAYQTPGAITYAQMMLNPQLSRQAVGAFPSALQQKTAIDNHTIFGAVQYRYPINEQMVVKSFIGINATQFKNPFITNYEKRDEVNMNAGVQLAYTPFHSIKKLKWVNGAEWLFNESNIQNYNNNKGFAAAIISKDIIYSKQQFYFSQLQLQLNDHLAITAGFSNNLQTYQYKRLTNLDSPFFNRTIQAPWVPRLSVLYKLNNQISVYTVIASGFSSPSLAEVRPSDGNFYPFLNAEKGWNIEMGIKGFLLSHKLNFDLAYYHFTLRDAIVRRNDAAGAEYFVNAGSTLQQGLECFFKYTLLDNKQARIQSLTVSNSFAFQPYLFKEYRQGQIDFTGNKLTGVPRTTNVLTATISTQKKYYCNLSFQANAAIPLNDANTALAKPYQLVQMKLGKSVQLKKCTLHIFVGGDNLLNQLYSLGNDINAAGARYYNPAPPRNWYTGIRFSFND